MNINELLSGFNQSQLQEINNFISSAQGKKLASSISGADKDRIIKQFRSLDPDVVKTRLSGLSAADLRRMFQGRQR